MALDRLDAIVIGASIEGLVAAAALAKAGRMVTVVEREHDPARMGEGEDGVISVGVARELELAEFGLRFAAPPTVAGISGDRALVLWPDLHAARASIAAFSARDAETYEAFQARVARAAVGTGGAGEHSVVAWLTSAAPDALPSEQLSFRLSPLARVLDEAFDNDLLKGVCAQGAVLGTGASPHAPGSAALLARSSMLAGAAPDLGYRFVIGGQTRLRQALLDQLKRFNNADVRFASEVQEITAEREVIQGVTLIDGGVMRAPVVISALSPNRNRELLAGFRRPPPIVYAPSARASVAPAMLKLTLNAMPKFPGLDAATLNAGAVVRLNPSIARLTRAHAAFRDKMLVTEPCLDIRLSPRQGADGKPRWTLYVAMAYLPVTTTEGPWAGNRRDRLRTLCVRAINAVVPDFAASIESAEILRPLESETVMDAKGPAALAAKASLDLTAVPDARAAAAPSLVKGLTVLESSVYASEGDAGLLAAHAVLGPRLKASADA